MKLILPILFIVICSCAQIQREADLMLNKDKYEEELKYKEGDIIEVEIPKKFYYKKADHIENLFIGSEIRFGKKSDVSARITKIKNFIKIDEYPRDYKSNVSHPFDNKKAVVAKVKILKLGRSIIKKHGSYGYFDEYEFVDWNKSFKKSVKDYISANKKVFLTKRRKEKMQNKVDAEFRQYESNGNIDKDVACYFSIINEQIKRIIKGQKIMSGFEPLTLMEKSELRNTTSKAKRYIKLHKNNYQKKSKKSWNRNSCSSFKKIKERGDKYGILLFTVL